MKPRVAVLITGYMRRFEIASLTWNNLLDYEKFDYDFFVHTYIEKGINNTTPYDIDLNDKFDFSLLNNLNIIKLVAEKTLEKNNSKDWTSDRVFYMFRKINLCYDLVNSYEKENNLSYHHYIRLRGDLFFTENCKELVESIEPESAYVPSLWGFVESSGEFRQLSEWSSNLVNDQFLISDKKTMEIYSSTIHNLVTLNGNFAIEESLFQNLSKNSIKINKINFKQGIYTRNKSL